MLHNGRRVLDTRVLLLPIIMRERDGLADAFDQLAEQLLKERKLARSKLQRVDENWRRNVAEIRREMHSEIERLRQFYAASYAERDFGLPLQ